MVDSKAKTLGQAIDEVVTALEPLDEATRLVAIRAACDHLGLTAAPALGSVAAPTGAAVFPSEPPAAPSAESGRQVADIRSFKVTKAPGTALEMACVVAHYVASVAPAAERKDSITSADLDKYFRQADYPLQKRMEQVLPDAKAAGYFDSAGRGSYRLNPVGYNLVVHGLPRPSASTSARGGKTRSRKVAPQGRSKARKK